MLPLHPGLLFALLFCFALSCPADVVGQNAGSTPPAQSSGRNDVVQPSKELPDSPGTIWAESQSPEQSPATQSATQSDSQAPDNNPQAPDNKKKDEKLQRPVGTAAAEAPKVSGVTAAQPAGAAIAPAKQHRVRTIVIRVGAILGAGAAVGTVVALSAATPSKPPGAH